AGGGAGRGAGDGVAIHRAGRGASDAAWHSGVGLRVVVKPRVGRGIGIVLRLAGQLASRRLGLGVHAACIVAGGGAVEITARGHAAGADRAANRAGVHAGGRVGIGGRVAVERAGRGSDLAGGVDTRADRSTGRASGGARADAAA